MTQAQIDSVVHSITRTEPSRQELSELAEKLRSDKFGEAYTVERYALTSLIDSMLSYLEYIQHDLEKSIGIRTTDELHRITNTLTYPELSDPHAQVSHLVSQWESFTKYTREDVQAIVAQ